MRHKRQAGGVRELSIQVLCQHPAALDRLATFNWVVEHRKPTRIAGPQNAAEVLLDRYVQQIRPAGDMFDSLRAVYIEPVYTKLHMNAENAPKLAEKTGVNSTVLAEVATKIKQGTDLTPQEVDELGRFDLILTTTLDAAYQRADQIYRNACKLAATVISVALALAGGYALDPKNFWHFGGTLGEALLVGLLATPIAPVAKDLSTAIQAGAKAIQAVRKFGR